MSDVIYVAMIVVMGFSILVLVLRKKISLNLRQIKMPFLEFDISSFKSISIVILFEAVTAIRIPPILQEMPDQLHPLLLLNAGWMMVCDAFVTRFNLYPTDENIRGVVHEIGSQNAEFVITFRKVYESSIKYGDRIDRNFAKRFVSRCPALSQRILRDNTPLEQFAVAQYEKWGLHRPA